MDDIGNIIYFLVVIVGLIAGFFQNRKKAQQQAPHERSNEWNQHEVVTEPQQQPEKKSGPRPHPKGKLTTTPQKTGRIPRPLLTGKKYAGRYSKQLEVIDLDERETTNIFQEIDLNNINWREAVILSEVLNRRTYGND